MDLRNFEEQEIILEQYKRFLNGLAFPIQIVIRNTYLDLSSYINYTKTNIARVENKILQKQWEEYSKFLENIDLQQGLIYVKEFYIVVPYYAGGEDGSQIKKARRSKLMDVLNAKDSPEKIVQRYRGFLKWKSQLDTRCSLISEWLAGLWIPTERINTSDIISLLFRFYNPLMHNKQSTLSE